jgi:hypothetical protein
LKRVELGLDPKDQPSPAGIFATQRMIVAYETYMYKVPLDQAYSSGAYDILLHDVVVLHDQRPTVAASALFDLDAAMNTQGDSVRVTLSLLPLDQTVTAAVFSYRPEDAAIAKSHLHRVLDSDGHHQKYELSRVLLNYCSNFVLSPAHFDTWSPKKRDVIKDYFTRTIMRGNLDYENPELFIF